MAKTKVAKKAKAKKKVAKKKPAKKAKAKKKVAKKKVEDDNDIWNVQCEACGAAYEDQRVTSPKNCGECGDIRIIKARGLLPEKLQMVRKARASGKVYVLMRCRDPQKDADGGKICKKTREVATQDLFQVSRCVPCQERFKQLNRAAKGRARRTVAQAKAAKKVKRRG